MSYLIRAPHVGEVEALADLHLRTWEQTYRHHFPASAWGEEARRNRQTMWRAICAAPRADDRIAVAERDGELIGLAGSGLSQDEPAPRERQLYFLYLLATEHGSGAGQALFDAVLGTDPASLWVLEDNPRARAFYARNGFAPDGARRSTGYATGGIELRLLR